MPCKPSAPPVHCGSALATSCSTSATPSVTMSRVRSLPRSTSRLVSRPTIAATTIATASPTSGSGVTCLHIRPAAYAPSPKNAAWPSEMMPAYTRMRSSDSANKARIAISVRIRCLPDGIRMAAKATSQKTISGQRQRARCARLGPALIARLSSCSGEQAVWPGHQHDDQHDIDHEAAERRGEIVLAHHVGDAEQERGHERTGNARRPAHRHDDQEIDHEAQRKVGI